MKKELIEVVGAGLARYLSAFKDDRSGDIVNFAATAVAAAKVDPASPEAHEAHQRLGRCYAWAFGQPGVLDCAAPLELVRARRSLAMAALAVLDNDEVVLPSVKSLVRFADIVRVAHREGS